MCIGEAVGGKNRNDVVQASDAMVRLVKSMEEGPSLDFTIIA
jgi:hypothetical protein